MSEFVPPADKQDLLHQMDAAWLRLNGFIDSLTPAQLTEPTDAAGWSVRDHLDHLRAWEQGMISALQRESRPAAMGVSVETWATGDIDLINEELRQATIEVALPEVRQRLATTHQRLREVVVATAVEDLHQPYRWFLPGSDGDNDGDDDERSMLLKVAGNSSYHMDEHLPWMLGIVGPPVP